jgi:phosphoglycerate dehydrogenase-like enzyme
VLIASYLEPEYAEQIARVDGIRVIYDPALLPAPRYQADHTSASIRRSPEEEGRWRGYLREAEVMFDFDYTNLDHLADLIPNVRWIQATSAGIGSMLVRTGLIRTSITFTTASGVHGVPLAEFVVMALLWFAKDGPRMLGDQAARRWQRTCARQLRGSTVGIVGLGGVGREVARTCRAMGLRVVATKRTVDAVRDDAVDALVPTAQLPTLLMEADALVLACPQTPETEGLIGRAELAMLKPGAIVVNIARGAVVDEPALIEALQQGRLGGAALDVAAQEPLPQDSPLWTLPNVLISPHSASTVTVENARLTELFCENLTRYLRGEGLRNLFDRTRLY